jgi:hypothetical protein
VTEFGEKWGGGVLSIPMRIKPGSGTKSSFMCLYDARSSVLGTFMCGHLVSRDTNTKETYDLPFFLFKLFSSFGGILLTVLNYV